MTANDSLADVARRRSQLELAMQQMAHVAAGAARQESWLGDMKSAVKDLEAALDNHIEEVEEPEALLDQIVYEAPRLQRRVEATIEHHVLLKGLVSDLLGALATSRQAEEPPATDIRGAVGEIMTELTQHRQDGADLIFEAYDVDIGGY